MMLFLAVGFAGCGSTTKRVICKQLKSAEFKPLAFYDVSFENERCRVRCHDFNQFAILPLKKCPEIIALALAEPDHYGEAITYTDKKTGETWVEEALNLPLRYCEGVGGWKPKDIATEIMPKIGKLYSTKEEFCD